MYHQRAIRKAPCSWYQKGDCGYEVGNIDFTTFTVAEWAMPIVMAISDSVAGCYSASSEFIESMIEACFKYAKCYQIPLLDIVGIKMKYNETRGHLHGCKY